ncbi:thioredoxin family protein [Luteitalea sp.]|jgi:thiol:disulfide interchange protein|uniref:thioredoxin family protein n=1 Tax=Luteitalea sp. TaxID=2004800 RepID=UPI0037CB05CF
MAVRRASRDTIVWGFVVAFLLLAQWPMLKGRYYQWRGTPAPASAIAWRTDHAAALAESARTGKPVLVDFAAGWCPPCVTMNHEVWPDPEVAALVARDYVPLKVDIDAHPDLADRYEVAGIPSVIVVNASGRVLRKASFLDAGGIRQFLSE